MVLRDELNELYANSQQAIESDIQYEEEKLSLFEKFKEAARNGSTVFEVENFQNEYPALMKNQTKFLKQLAEEDMTHINMIGNRGTGKYTLIVGW